MAIDPSIAIRAGNAGWSLGDILQQAEQSKFRNQQMQMQRQQFEQQQAEVQRQQQANTSLANLAATYKPGTGYDMQSAAAQQYRQADPSGYVGILDKMDTQQREHLKAGLDDIGSAVQWTQNEQDWAKVQQHYAPYIPEIASIPYANRQEVLLKVNKLGEYLKATAPELKSVEPGGGLYSVGKDGSGFKVVVAPNDGSQSLGAPAGGQPGGLQTKVLGGKTYYQTPDGKWHDSPPEGGAGSNVGGNF